MPTFSGVCMRKKSDESCTTGRKRHILYIGVSWGAKPKSKRKQKIRQMFPFQKGLKLSKKLFFFNIFSLYLLITMTNSTKFCTQRVLGMLNTNLKGNRRFNRCFLFQKGLKLSKKLSFSHFRTILIKTNGKWHIIMHIKVFWDAKP